MKLDSFLVNTSGLSQRNSVTVFYKVACPNEMLTLYFIKRLAQDNR